MTIVPVLSRLMELAGASAARLVERARRLNERHERGVRARSAVVVVDGVRVDRRDPLVQIHAGPELRLSLIAIESPQMAALRKFPGALHLYTVMLSCADKLTGRCTQYTSELCKNLGCDRGTLNGHLAKLIELKFLRYEQQTNVLRSKTRKYREYVPQLPPEVAKLEQDAMERGNRMSRGTGDEYVSKNSSGVVYLRRAIVSARLVTSDAIRLVGRSGLQFHLWLFYQAQTWARKLKMTSRWIAEKLHALSSEARKGHMKSSAMIRDAQADLQLLGVLQGEGGRYDSKTWWTPETLHLPGRVLDQSEAELPAVVRDVEPGPDVDPYAQRLVDEWLGLLGQRGALDQRRLQGASAEELALARRMAVELAPWNSEEPDPAAEDPVWLSRAVSWMHAAVLECRRPPVMLTELWRQKPPDWLPLEV